MSEQATKKVPLKAIAVFDGGTKPIETANGTGTPTEANPWAGIIGKYKDDPVWDEVMAHIREQRRLDKEKLAQEAAAEEESCVSL